MSEYTVEARHADFTRAGRIDRLTRLRVISRFNGIGTWQFSLAMGSAQAALMTQLAGVIIHYGDLDGPVLMSGPVVHIGEQWDDSNAGGDEDFEDSQDEGTLTVSGVSDDIVIADRLAWPNPGSTIANQTTNGYDKRTGAAETIIKQYVDVNAGLGALADRQTPGLTIEADQARGSSVTFAARMKPLEEVVSEIALTPNLGWRVRQVGTGREFQVYEPADRTLTARFGRDLRNLISFDSTREAPKTTRPIVGGGGEDVARKFRQLVDGDSETGWGRKIEAFVDARHTEVNVELDQKASEAIVEGGPQTSVSIQTIDTEGRRFGVDYGLGDRITVEPSPGRLIRDVLREVDISWSAEEGATTKSQVGSAETSSTPRQMQRLERLNKRVAELEAKK